MTGTVRIAGYASLFGIRDGAGDRVEKGAFRRSIGLRPARRIAMLWQHDPAAPVGVWTRIAETGRGLWVEGELTTAVTRAREAAHLIGAGALTGLSIGFHALKATRGPRGINRSLLEIDLWEISLVTFPQADGARVRLAADDRRHPLNRRHIVAL